MRFRFLASILMLWACLPTAFAEGAAYSVTTVAKNGLVAKLFMPSTARGAVSVVIAVGGSEGGLTTGNAYGELLAPQGIAVLGLAYFDAPGLPKTLDQIPLEYFKTAVDYLETVTGVDAKRIGLVGGSRGAELALLFSAMEPRIKSVVATTPSSVAWFGQTLAQSAWTLGGKGIPALSLELDAQAPLLARFEAALKNHEAGLVARIAIERIRGPIFLISAEGDQVWPSTSMADAMVEDLKQRGFAFPVTHRPYPTGHGFSQETAPEIKQSIVDHFLKTL
jgi:uncharacterized protein